MTFDQTSSRVSQERWLRTYYFTRAAFSIAWVLLALTLGKMQPLLGSILLVLYPVWDAAANYVDAVRNGGLARNRTQAINVVVSAAAALAVLVALQVSLNAVLAVFGAWALVSGLLQFGTALRRWKTSGAQWAMVLSGGQSALAGTFFVLMAQQDVPAVIPTLAGYAGFGAVYFLVAAVLLVFRKG